MSSAGKKSLFAKFRSLLRAKKQAPSFKRLTSRVEAEFDRLDRVIPEWVERKGYWTPAKTISGVAEQLGTESVILQRYCHERLHVDFRTWRTALRVEDAKKMLLENPEAPASSIALKVGFSDRSNFLHQFRALTGLTPTEWRHSQTGKARHLKA